MWGVSQPATRELLSSKAGRNVIPPRVLFSSRYIRFPFRLFCLAPPRPPLTSRLFESCGAGSKELSVNGCISSELSVSLYRSVANLPDQPDYPVWAVALERSPRMLAVSRRHFGAAAATVGGRDAVLRGVTEGRRRDSVRLLIGRSRRR